MVTFLKYLFTIEPAFVEELRAEMKEFDWLNDFVSVNDEGEITLFDIRDGLTEDAITQVMGALSEEGVASMSCDIVACDTDRVIRCRVIDGWVVVRYAVDFVWSDKPV